MDGKIEDVQLVLVQFVNHEPDDFFAMFRDHADTVALAQAPQEIFFRPGVLEAQLLGLQNFGHVATNHPADMHPRLFLVFFGSTRVHLPNLPSPRSAKPPPWVRRAAALSSSAF